MNVVTSTVAAAPAAPLYHPDDHFTPLEIGPDELARQNIFGFRNADNRARPFKMLRTQLARRASEDGLKLIGVTSAAPAVGKTFVAANLAAALSRIAELDVCLIDLDLHRPAQGPRFGLKDRPGIHDWLSGEVADIREVGLRVNDERLVLLPGFRRDVATGELLASTRGDALFAGLRALPSSTLVIVDMPPIFADDDAVLIAHRIDGFILVAEDGKTTRKQLHDTIRMLAPTPMLGTVLNRYRRQVLSDDYGYGASYGYGSYY